MTTLVGITAEKGKKYVSMGSDQSRTRTEWRPQGDVAYRQQTRREGQKIYIADDNRFAVSMSGIFDESYTNFLSDILNGKIDLEKVIRDGIFPQLKELNLNRWGDRIPDMDFSNGLLLATRFGNNPSLYTCWPLGRVEPRAYTSIGSGSQYAIEFIGESGKIIPGRINVEEAIDLTVGALDKASQDIYTGGLDLVIVSPEKIQSHGEQIRRVVAEAREAEIARVKESLKD